MKVLFVCNQNQNRSKTAEKIFSDKFETMSKGLYNENPIISKDINWADIIFVMQEEQRKELAKRFPYEYMKKRILNLDIPDIYHLDQHELISLLEKKVNEILLAIH